jgi:hypothetical protein
MPLMAQSSLGAVWVTGSEQVSAEALEKVRALTTAMLAARPDLVAPLQAAGVVHGVWAIGESICDLDYFADWQPLPLLCFGTYAGGAGATLVRPASAASELNALQSAEDPYRGENLHVHEFSHDVMNIALSEQDRQDIRARHETVKAAGMWAYLYNNEWYEPYATLNHEEFFAETSQSYFCVNQENIDGSHNGVNCPAELLALDPETFALLDRIWGFAGNPPDLR